MHEPADLADRAVELYMHRNTQTLLQESDALARKAGGVVDPNVLNAIASQHAANVRRHLFGVLAVYERMSLEQLTMGLNL